MKTHRLKTANPYFSDTWEHRKPFELRKNDRNFEVGDRVELVEFDPSNPDLLAREIHGHINYLLKDYAGLESGFCIFSCKVLFYQESERYTPPASRPRL